MANPLIMPQQVSPQQVRQLAETPPGTPPSPQPMAGPPGAGGPMPTPPVMPSPEELSKAHDHLSTIIDEMTGLIGQTPGTLSRKDVMDAAGRMIKKGAFPNADGKKQLVSTLANLPDNEQAIRQFLGQHLLTFAAARQQLGQLLGGNQGQPPTPQEAQAASEAENL